jgi:site-specific recombinase XerD
MSNSTEFPTTKENRVPANKRRRYPPEVLVPGEVHALLEACSINPRTDLRNRALITVLYRAGLRCSDAPVIVRRFPLAAWERQNWPSGADR